MSRDFALHPQLVKDTVVIGELTLCCVRLMNDTNYPWLVLVPVGVVLLAGCCKGRRINCCGHTGADSDGAAATPPRTARTK